MHDSAPARCDEAVAAPTTPAWAQPRQLLPPPSPVISSSARKTFPLRANDSNSPQRSFRENAPDSPRAPPRPAEATASSRLENLLLSARPPERRNLRQDGKRVSVESVASTCASSGSEALWSLERPWSSSASTSSTSSTSAPSVGGERGARDASGRSRQRSLSRLESQLIQANQMAAKQLAERDEQIESLEARCVSLLERLLVSERQHSDRDSATSSSSSLHSTLSSTARAQLQRLAAHAASGADQDSGSSSSSSLHSVLSHTARAQLQRLAAHAAAGADQASPTSVASKLRRRLGRDLCSLTSTCASSCSTQPGTPTSPRSPRLQATTSAVQRLIAQTGATVAAGDTVDDTDSVSSLVAPSGAEPVADSGYATMEDLEALCQKSEDLLRMVISAIGEDELEPPTSPRELRGQVVAAGGDDEKGAPASPRSARGQRPRRTCTVRLPSPQKESSVQSASCPSSPLARSSRRAAAWASTDSDKQKVQQSSAASKARASNHAPPADEGNLTWASVRDEVERYSPTARAWNKQRHGMSNAGVPP